MAIMNIILKLHRRQQEFIALYFFIGVFQMFPYAKYEVQTRGR